MISQSETSFGIAPIFGRQPCCLLTKDGYLKFSDAGLGSRTRQGFSFGIDLQCETTEACVLLGSGTSFGISIIVHYNAGDIRNQIQVDLRDDDGRMLSASVQLSKYVAKRLLVAIDVNSNTVRFSEFNLFQCLRNMPVFYLKQESPRSFGDFAHDIFLGGACVDGERYGSIAGKVGNFIIWDRVLSYSEMEDMLAASKAEVERFYGKEVYLVEESEERRSIFKSDMRKLHNWIQKPYLSGDDTRDAANVLYRWLLDRHPMLQDLSNELGIQLTLPGESRDSKELRRKAVTYRAELMFVLVVGKRNPLGYEWVTRRRFVESTLLIVDYTPIKVREFIEFVRNKLGGSHFDLRDRKKWRKKLTEMTRYWKTDHDFLNHHMKELIGPVWEGVQENRIEQGLG